MDEQKNQIGTMEVRGTELPVYAYMHNYRTGKPSGGFMTELNGKMLTASSMEGLYDAAMNESRRQAVKIELPFTAFADGRVKHGVVTGVHAGNGNFMVSFDGGKTEQYDGYTNLRSLSEDEVAEWKRLRKAEAEARVARSNFEKENHIDLRKEVENAIKGKVEELAGAAA